VELDSVQIGAADPDAAAAGYAILLGVEPVAGRFQLERGAVEIVAGEPGVRSIRFRGEPARGWPDEFHGLDVLRTAAPPAASACGVAIDHVVVQTADAARAIALWQGRVGLRLALDRVFPERGLRLLFFRSGGITLEFATSEPPPAAPVEPDRLHGVSYRVSDLAARRERLLAAGFDVSPVRTGMRPGTSVATVRSGTAGVPTLLLQVYG
jgi:catechol 2,3-dioxygenase-like lactoylglutathione lyase family enzyme